MPQHAYHRVDVFTDRVFGGNQLAVFPDARDIPQSLFQPIAREFNLSETTFVLPPEREDTHFRLRIFTPMAELPMAGHPTVGTAYVLARLGLFDPAQGPLVFGEGVGPVPVDIQPGTNPNSPYSPEPGRITMSQPLPRFEEVPIGEGGLSLADVAGLLDLPADQILSKLPHSKLPHPKLPHSKLPVQIVSCGVPYLMIPLRDRAALGAAKPRLDRWDATLANCPAKAVLAFCFDPETPQAQVRARMFAPALGVLEDSATGSAAGPLGCYLARHGAIDATTAVGATDATDATLRILAEQGMEMGRPSLLHIAIDHTGGEISAVRVGGDSVYLGHGVLDIPSPG